MSIQQIFNDSRLMIYTIDEHHEAYLAWANSLSGFSNNKRMLVHIDEHADFGCPYLTEPIPNNDESIETLKKFVYRQLTIGTFLIPSAAALFYSELIWIKPSRKLRYKKEHLYLQKSSEFPYLNKSNIPIEASQEICYQTGGWELSSHVSGEWMLDICLDAFICNSNLDHDPFILEISESQFRTLNLFELNMWNLRYGSAATFFELDRRYYFRLDVGTWSGPEKIVRNFNYIDKLKKLEEFLLVIRHAPKVITLSRSIKSGYTPRNVAGDLERAITDIIFKRYGI